MPKKTKKIGAINIAEYFIGKGNEEMVVISNKKLQKLVYYSQAWFLVLKNEKLFSDKIEAWVHGPAIRILYVKYKKFGFSPIKKEADVNLIKSISDNTKEFLNDIWKVYGKKDAGYLEMLTHSELPWQDAREGLQNSESSNNEITIKSMKSFYTEKLREVQSRK
jgi:uncharacterized phage-associated protein